MVSICLYSAKLNSLRSSSRLLLLPCHTLAVRTCFWELESYSGDQLTLSIQSHCNKDLTFDYDSSSSESFARPSQASSNRASFHCRGWHSSTRARHLQLLLCLPGPAYWSVQQLHHKHLFPRQPLLFLRCFLPLLLPETKLQPPFLQLSMLSS